MFLFDELFQSDSSYLHIHCVKVMTLQEIAPGFPWCFAGLSQAIGHFLGHAPDFLVQWTLSRGSQFLWRRSCAGLSQVERLVTSVLKSILLTPIFHVSQSSRASPSPSSRTSSSFRASHPSSFKKKKKNRIAAKICLRPFQYESLQKKLLSPFDPNRCKNLLGPFDPNCCKLVNC